MLRIFLLAVMMWPFFTLLFNARKKASVGEDLSQLGSWMFQYVFKRAPSNERLVETIHETLSLPDSEFVHMLKIYLAKRALRKAIQTSGPSALSNIKRPPHLKKNEAENGTSGILVKSGVIHRLPSFSGKTGASSSRLSSVALKGGVARLGSMRVSAAGQGNASSFNLSGRPSFLPLMSPKGPVAESTEIEEMQEASSDSSPRNEIEEPPRDEIEGVIASPAPLDAPVAQSFAETKRESASNASKGESSGSNRRSSINQQEPTVEKGNKPGGDKVNFRSLAR